MASFNFHCFVKCLLNVALLPLNFCLANNNNGGVRQMFFCLKPILFVCNPLELIKIAQLSCITSSYSILQKTQYALTGRFS